MKKGDFGYHGTLSWKLLLLLGWSDKSLIVPWQAKIVGCLIWQLGKLRGLRAGKLIFNIMKSQTSFALGLLKRSEIKKTNNLHSYHMIWYINISIFLLSFQDTDKHRHWMNLFIYINLLQDKQLLGTLDISPGHPTSPRSTAWHGKKKHLRWR